MEVVISEESVLGEKPLRTKKRNNNQLNPHACVASTRFTVISPPSHFVPKSFRPGYLASCFRAI